MASSTGVEKRFCISTRILAASLLTFAALTTGNALLSTIGAGKLCCWPRCRNYSPTKARINCRPGLARLVLRGRLVSNRRHSRGTWLQQPGRCTLVCRPRSTFAFSGDDDRLPLLCRDSGAGRRAPGTVVHGRHSEPRRGCQSHGWAVRMFLQFRIHLIPWLRAGSEYIHHRLVARWIVQAPRL